MKRFKVPAGMESQPRTPSTSRFALNDRVGWAKLFLKNLSTPATDDAWRRLGTVVGFHHDFVILRWDNDTEDVWVLNCNLAKVGSGKWAEDI